MAKPAKLPAATAANLASEAKHGAIRAGVIAFIALLVGAFTEQLLVVLAIGLTIGGLLVAFVYGRAAYRTNQIRRTLPDEARRVLAIGWTRAPDGSNYAIYPTGSDTERADPELVLKLSSTRAVGSARALLLGSDEPKGTAALVDDQGNVLAVGVLRSSESARKVWARRGEPEPRWAGAGGRKTPPPTGKPR